MKAASAVGLIDESPEPVNWVVTKLAYPAARPARLCLMPTPETAPLESLGLMFIRKGSPTWSTWVVLMNSVPSLGLEFRIVNSTKSKLMRVFGSDGLLIAGKEGLSLKIGITGGWPIPNTTRVETMRAFGLLSTWKLIFALGFAAAAKSWNVGTVGKLLLAIETNRSGLVKSFTPAFCRGTR